MQAWVPEGGQQFGNFSIKAVFLVSSGKNKISPLLVLLKILWNNPLVSPLEKQDKNPSDAQSRIKVYREPGAIFTGGRIS